MKNPNSFTIELLLVCLFCTVSGCTEVEDEKMGEFTNKVATIRIVAEDTLFTTSTKTQTLKIFREFLDGFGNVVYFDEAPQQVLYINGKSSSSYVIDSSIETEYSIQVKVGNRESNVLTVRVIDVNPDKYIWGFEAVMGDSTYSPYAIAGQSVVDFGVKFYNYRGKEFDKSEFPEYTFYLDGKEYSDLNGIPVERAGSIPFYVESGDIKSEVKYLISRNPPDFSNIYQLPVIFHIVYLENEEGVSFNHEAEEIYQLLKSANDLFRNLPRNDLRKSHNTVDPGIQFTLSTTDTLGNRLEEPGINRIKTDKLRFPYNDGNTYKYLFDHLWNPEKYVNVFILNISGVSGFASYPRYQQAPDGFAIPLINYGYMAAIGGVGNPYLLLHELGHFLGLPHVYHEDESNHCKDSDGIPDTESYFRPENENNSPVYCGTNEFYSTNFMDAKGAKNSFTLDQALKMRSVIERNIYLPEINSTARKNDVPFQKGKFDPTIKLIDYSY